MNNYILSCCSTVDLSVEHMKSINVSYIYFHYLLDGVQYDDDLGQTMSFKEFYDHMRNGADTKTSQINADEFQAYFEPFLKEGKDIFHVTLSSGLSGVINSATIARDILSEKYPDRKIYILDSLSASSGYGLMMDTLAELRDQGKTMDELKDWVETNRLHLHHWFFSTDLTFYIKGGRVSKAEGTIGNLLNICPLLNVNKEGKLVKRDKVRTKRKVYLKIVEQMLEHAQNGSDYSGKCFISHSDCIEDAKAVASLIEDQFPKLNGKVNINYISTTIGSHTGPNTVALFFYGDERNE